MSRIGIIESTVPIGKYLETDRESKESSIYVLNLSSNAEFVVNSEILQKLNYAKCQLLLKDATIKSLNDLLVQADSTLKSLQNQLQDEQYTHYQTRLELQLTDEKLQAYETDIQLMQNNESKATERQQEYE